MSSANCGCGSIQTIREVPAPITDPPRIAVLASRGTQQNNHAAKPRCIRASHAKNHAHRKATLSARLISGIARSRKRRRPTRRPAAPGLGTGHKAAAKQVFPTFLFESACDVVHGCTVSAHVGNPPYGDSCFVMRTPHYYGRKRAVADAFYLAVVCADGIVECVVQ